AGAHRQIVRGTMNVDGQRAYRLATVATTSKSGSTSDASRRPVRHQHVPRGVPLHGALGFVDAELAFVRRSRGDSAVLGGTLLLGQVPQTAGCHGPQSASAVSQ